MIVPTVGRKVWFYESAAQLEPMDATIIRTFSDTPTAYVNLDVVDPDTGVHRCCTSVQVGDESTKYRHYRWMPYQMGQAAKPRVLTEADAAADLAGTPYPAA